MKRKIFSALAVVLFMSSSLNASSNLKKVVYYGKASDCVKMARGAVMNLAAASGEDPNGDNFDFYINLYLFMYEDCLIN